jgi:uncharacterized membrane protein YhhN
LFKTVLGELFMTATLILFSILYLGGLIAYFFSETSGNYERRVVNKCFLAGMFLAIGWGGLIESAAFDAVGILLAFGLLFSALGDVLLLKSFTFGGISFGVGNVILFLSYLFYLKGKGIPFSSYWWFLIILVLFIAVWMYLEKSKWIQFGKYGINMHLYLFSVMLHGTLSIAGLFFLHDPKSVLLFVGSILFMISDWFISLHKFKYKESKWVLRTNSGTYFLGLLLIALSCHL